jgi:transcriptional regulator with XRE-family HTH domain
MKKNLHNPEYEAFAARLRQAMKDAGLKASATHLADSFNLRYWGEGITAHAARNWMFGVSMPKQDKLKALSEVLNISPQDLLFGPQRELHAVQETQLTDGMGMGDTEMLRQYLQLQPEHKRMVRQWVRMSLAFQHSDSPRLDRLP